MFALLYVVFGKIILFFIYYCQNVFLKIIHTYHIARFRMFVINTCLIDTKGASNQKS